MNISANVSDILDKISFSGTNWAQIAISSPSGIAVNEPGYAMVYIVVDNSVTVARREAEPLTLSAGEAAIFLSGETHTIRLTPDASLTSVSYFRQDRRPDSLPKIDVGGNGIVTTILAGRLDLSVSPTSPLLALAPPTILLRRYDGAGQTQINMQHIKEIFARSKEQGGATFLTRIANLLLLRGLHQHVTRTRNMELLPKSSGVARALQLIGDRLSTYWTVERLAQEIGMSRSAFAAEFHSTTNQGPMGYLRDRRLEQGASLLLEHGARVGDVAATVGYRSEAAFARAFVKKYGTTPSQYRMKSRYTASPRHGAQSLGQS